VTIAFSDDRDNADDECDRPICNEILSIQGKRKTVIQLIADVTNMDLSFMADFSHF
jgi:hypothetical protein